MSQMLKSKGRIATAIRPRNSFNILVNELLQSYGYFFS